MAYNTLGSNVGQYFDWPRFEPLWQYTNQGHDFHREVMSVQYIRRGFVFQPPKSGNISHIGFYLWLCLANGADMTAVVEEIDLTTGYPNGTVLGASGSASFLTTDNNTHQSIALGTVAPVEQGVPVAVYFEKGATSRLDIGLHWQTVSNIPLFPRIIRDDTGVASPTWSTDSQYVPFNVEIRYDDGSYAHIAENYPLVYMNRDFTGGSGTDRWGIKFTSPGNWRARGVAIRGQIVNTDINFRITDVATETDHILYALDGSIMNGQPNTRKATRWICEAGDEFDLKAGVEYYLTADAGNISAMEGPSSGYTDWLDQYTQGANVQPIGRNSTTGVYSVTNDYQMPLIGLMIDAVSPVQPGINIPLIAAS